MGATATPTTNPLETFTSSTFGLTLAPVPVKWAAATLPASSAPTIGGWTCGGIVHFEGEGYALCREEVEGKYYRGRHNPQGLTGIISVVSSLVLAQDS